VGRTFLSNYQRKVDRLLDKDVTYIFEFCSIYNKVVRTYTTPMSFLLSAVNRKTLEEVSREGQHDAARLLGCHVPLLHTFSSIDDILAYLDDVKVEATFEGFVIQDDKGNRMKIKNKKISSNQV
jgi:hypothetical protein